MNTTTKVLIGAGLVLGLGYVGMKYYYPPSLSVYSLNPLDGSGTMKFGKAGGGIGPGTFDGGWGWTATFTGFVPGSGWTVLVQKNGKVYKTITLVTVGQINIV